MHSTHPRVHKSDKASLWFRSVALARGPPAGLQDNRYG